MYREDTCERAAARILAAITPSNIQKVIVVIEADEFLVRLQFRTEIFIATVKTSDCFRIRDSFSHENLFPSKR